MNRATTKASTTHMVTQVRCDTQGMPTGTQLCPHCSLEEGRAWTTCDHLHKFGPEQCFSRPGGPLQGLTGPTREARRKELVHELFARLPGIIAKGKAEPKAAATAAAAKAKAVPEAKAVKAKTKAA